MKKHVQGFIDHHATHIITPIGKTLSSCVTYVFLVLCTMIMSLVVSRVFDQHVGALLVVDPYEKLNKDSEKIIETNDITNPLRDGAYNPGQGVNGLYNDDQTKITDFVDAKRQTKTYIQRMINWFLGGIGAIALVYLIYNFFIMMTAAGDDKKYKQGFEALKYATFALLGIGLSALFINAAFYLVARFT